MASMSIIVIFSPWKKKEAEVLRKKVYTNDGFVKKSTKTNML